MKAQVTGLTQLPRDSRVPQRYYTFSGVETALPADILPDVLHGKNSLTSHYVTDNTTNIQRKLGNQQNRF